MQPSQSFSLNWDDIKVWGEVIFVVIGAVLISFVITAVLPTLGGNWAIVALVLTPILHGMLQYLKGAASGGPAGNLLAALPGKDQQ